MLLSSVERPHSVKKKSFILTSDSKVFTPRSNFSSFDKLLNDLYSRREINIKCMFN